MFPQADRAFFLSQVFYDEQKDFYTQLAEVQQQILGGC